MYQRWTISIILYHPAANEPFNLCGLWQAFPIPSSPDPTSFQGLHVPLFITLRCWKSGGAAERSRLGLQYAHQVPTLKLLLCAICLGLVPLASTLRRVMHPPWRVGNWGRRYLSYYVPTGCSSWLKSASTRAKMLRWPFLNHEGAFPIYWYLVIAKTITSLTFSSWSRLME